MGDLDSKLNAAVLIALCAVGYYFFLRPAEPIQPPSDAWFQQKVVDQPGQVLVKFGAPWCGPCQALDGQLDKLEEAGVHVVRIDVGQHPELAQHYGVSSIPRMFLCEHGVTVADRVGYADVQQIRSWMAAHRTPAPHAEGAQPVAAR
jgi:thioredoxin-like negative regulator of GroEL